jgi:hypothetical protein
LAELTWICKTTANAERLSQVAQTNTARRRQLPVHFVTYDFFDS